MTTSSDSYPVRDKVLEISKKIVEIADVIQFGSFVRFDPFQPLEEGSKVQTRQVAMVVGTAQDGNELAVDFQFEFQVRQPSAEEPPETQPKAEEFVSGPIRVMALYRVRYRLADDSKYDEESLAAFGSVNTHFNLTSYWREFLSSACGRAGYNAVKVDPFDAMRALGAVDRRAKEARERRERDEKSESGQPPGLESGK